MKGTLLFLLAVTVVNTNLNAAEAGMPQLDPTYWASQAFWLILVFTILYISISKFYLPKIIPIPTPAPANAIAARPAPIIFAASNSIFPPFLINGVNLMHRLNKCRLILQKHKLVEKLLKFPNLLTQLKN